jgi:hypothetical protein
VLPRKQRGPLPTHTSLRFPLTAPLWQADNRIIQSSQLPLPGTCPLARTSTPSCLPLSLSALPFNPGLLDSEAQPALVWQGQQQPQHNVGICLHNRRRAPLGQPTWPFFIPSTKQSYPALRLSDSYHTPFPSHSTTTPAFSIIALLEFCLNLMNVHLFLNWIVGPFLRWSWSQTWLIIPFNFMNALISELNWEHLPALIVVSEVNVF